VDFSLTESEGDLVGLCREFAQKEIARRAPLAWEEALCPTDLLREIRGERRREPLPADARRTALLRFGLGSLVYLVAIAIAFVSAKAAVALIAAVAVYCVFEQTPSSHRVRDAG
jgi:hypothetical protein